MGNDDKEAKRGNRERRKTDDKTRIGCDLIAWDENANRTGESDRGEDDGGGSKGGGEMKSDVNGDWGMVGRRL
jgi:hypothetical protein